MRRLVFDQSSPVHPVSESRGGGGTLSVTDKQTKDEGWKSLCLIVDAFIVKRVDIQSFSFFQMH